MVDRILLVLTTRCNLGECAYCFQNTRNPGEMPWETLREGVCLALSEGSSQPSVIFSGGEPLLEFRQLREAVEYAEAYGTAAKRLRYWLITNGTLFTGEVADFLQRQKFTVQMSFDGIAAAQGYRGAHTFEILDRLLDSLRNEHQDLFRHQLQIAMTVIPPTVRHMTDSVAYFLKKGVREMSIAPCLTHFPGWQIPDIAELDTQFAAISDLSQRHLDLTGEVPVKILRKSNGDMGRGDPVHRLCGGLRGTSLAVDVDGQVYGCPLFAESCQKFPEGSLMHNLRAIRMGDIRDPAFPERRATAIHAAQQLLPPDWEARRYSSYGKCIDCPHRGGCFICPVSVWSKPDDTGPFRVPDFICAFNRVVSKHRERFPGVPGLIDI